jgi:hypothetical protein
MPDCKAALSSVKTDSRVSVHLTGSRNTVTWSLVHGALVNELDKKPGTLGATVLP